ncbi:MAG: hypothetical protein ChlgKO_12630 [Chlamydiales bacterium]
MQPMETGKAGSSSIFDSSVQDQGRTSLHKAIYNKDIDLVRRLVLDPNTDVNGLDKSGNTPLHCAVNLRSPAYSEIAKILLARYDIEPSKPDSLGYTPLRVVAILRHLQIFRLLICHQKVDVGEILKPLRKMSTAEKEDALTESETNEIVRYIVAKKHLLNYNSCIGWRLLHYAAAFDDLDLINELTNDHGVDINLLTGDKKNIFCIALFNKSFRVLEMLFNNDKVNLNAPGNPKNCTPLTYSVVIHDSEERKKMVTFALKYQYWFTLSSHRCPYDYPLHLAAQHGHIDAMKLLLKSNFGIYEKDIYGNTPIDVARKHGRGNVVQFLYSWS